MTLYVHAALAALAYFALKFAGCPHDIALSTAVLITPAINPSPVTDALGVVASKVKRSPKEGS